MAPADSNNRMSDTLRMSVLETAMEIGLTSDAIQKWMFDPIAEGREERDGDETSLSPGLTSASTAASDESLTSPYPQCSHRPPNFDYNSKAMVLLGLYDTPRSGTPVRSDGMLPSKDRNKQKFMKGGEPSGQNANDTSPSQTLRGQGSFTPSNDSGYATDASSQKKTKKSKKFFGRGDGYSSDGGSLSSSKPKSKKSRDNSTDSLPVPTPNPVISPSPKKPKPTLIIPKSPGKATKASNASGYDTDGGYISESTTASPSKSKSKSFFRRRGSSAKKVSYDESSAPPVPPMPLPLPIAQRFARTESEEARDEANRSGTPVTVATNASGASLELSRSQSSSEQRMPPMVVSRAPTPRVDPFISRELMPKKPDLKSEIRAESPLLKKSDRPRSPLPPQTRPPPVSALPPIPIIKAPIVKDKDEDGSKETVMDRLTHKRSILSSPSKRSPPRRQLSTRDISLPNPHLNSSLKPPPSSMDILKASQNRTPSPVPLVSDSEYVVVDHHIPPSGIGENVRPKPPSTPMRPRRPSQLILSPINSLFPEVLRSPTKPGIGPRLAAHHANIPPPSPPPTGPLPSVPTTANLQVQPPSPMPSTPGSVQVVPPSPGLPISPKRSFFSSAFLGRAGSIRDMRSRSPSPSPSTGLTRGNSIAVATMSSAVNLPSRSPSPGLSFTPLSRPASPMQRGRQSPFPAQPLFVGSEIIANLRSRSPVTRPTMQGYEAEMFDEPDVYDGVEPLRPNDLAVADVIIEEEDDRELGSAIQAYADESNFRAKDNYLDLEDIDEDDDKSYYPDDDKTAGRRTIIWEDDELCPEDEHSYAINSHLAIPRPSNQIYGVRNVDATSSKHSLATTVASRPVSFIDGERSAELRTRFLNKVQATYGYDGREIDWEDGSDIPPVPPLPPAVKNVRFGVPAQRGMTRL